MLYQKISFCLHNETTISNKLDLCRSQQKIIYRERNLGEKILQSRGRDGVKTQSHFFFIHQLVLNNRIGFK